jgi:hypothetical protein
MTARRLGPASYRGATPMIAVGVIAALAAGCGSSSNGNSSTGPTSGASTGSAAALAPIHGKYSPPIDPADFVATIDNRYFPLKPGTSFHYEGVQEDGRTPLADDQVVTQQTKVILGVKCTVVRDTVSSRGRVIERTLDWYAQDRYGNVWYMGEDTRELKHGRFVKMSDSWEAGVDGAEAGIIMPGKPHPGDEYRQEYYPGHALDQARVLGRGGRVVVRSGSYPKTLLTVETSPQIDPGVAERKWYVAGIGDVKEHTVSGNREQIELVSVSH